MSVLSAAFLAWIAASVTLHWAAPRGARPALLALLTLAFLASVSPLAALLLAAFAALSFVAARHPRPGVATVVAVSTLVAGWLSFKLPAAGLGQPLEAGPAVPLGLSYFALRAIHYLVESYKGSLPEHSPVDYAAYMAFLPTIVAGPIHRFDGFSRDLRRQRWDPRLASRGLERVLYGYAKIVLLGNVAVSHLFAAWAESFRGTAPALHAYLDCVRYGLNLYFQFAGYSDVAIGFALLLGFRVMENFDRPFLRPNIGAFWQAWHASLSSWCRDYVYMPVAAGTRRRVAAVLAAMVVLGIWHEPSARYLAWGLLHGVAILVWHGFALSAPLRPRAHSPWARRAATALSTALTANFVLLSFALTKEPDLASGLAVYGAILSGIW